jgi:ATP-binding cassette subfamily C (CFTR/MRP) protein 4
MTVLNFMAVVAICLGAVTLSCVMNVFILLPIMPLILLFVYVRQYFLVSSTEIKRIEGISIMRFYLFHFNSATTLNLTFCILTISELSYIICA